MTATITHAAQRFPTLPPLFIGRDKTYRLIRQTGDFRWTDWADIWVHIPDLSITKQLTVSGLTVEDDDTLKWDLLNSDSTGKEEGLYVFYVEVTNGVRTFYVGEGLIPAHSVPA